MSAETFLNGKVTLHAGDSRDVLKILADNSIDSIVCDPPYALVSIVKRFGAGGAPVKVPEGGSGAYARASAGFMGKTWDTGETAFAVDFWAECIRVLKPGGHVVAFSGTRTYHRMACAIEDAGFEVRDMLSWLYGSGFPKSHDVSKGIDKASGIWRGRAGAVKEETVGQAAKGTEYERTDKGEPLTDAARQWQGWGTALKPAVEPICLARKPLIGTVAGNVLEHGTGAINIDGCRIETDDEAKPRHNKSVDEFFTGKKAITQTPFQNGGRWPANIIHDGSDEVVAAFPSESGGAKTAKIGSGSGGIWSESTGKPAGATYADSGSAARFFYTAKADKQDRIGSKHPTVKPVDLMQWLCRLVTPKRVLFCPKCDTLNHAESTANPRENQAVRLVPDELQAEGQPPHGALLQQAMRGGEQGPPTETMRVVRNDIPAAQGRREAVLQSDLRCEMERKEPAISEGVCNQQEGLSPALDAGSSAIAQPEGLYLRAPLGGAAEDGATSDEGRGSPSQKRNQNGQSPGKLGTDAQGRSRQTESPEAEHALLPSLSGQDHNQPTCKDCGHVLEWRPGRVLDPFAGTGTTGEAAFRESFNAVLIEREPEYQADIRRRMALCMAGPDERRRESIKAKVGDVPFEPGSLFAGIEAAE